MLTKMFAKRFHCFLARFKISAMGGMEYYQEKKLIAIDQQLMGGKTAKYFFAAFAGK